MGSMNYTLNREQLSNYVNKEKGQAELLQSLGLPVDAQVGLVQLFHETMDPRSPIKEAIITITHPSIDPNAAHSDTTAEPSRPAANGAPGSPPPTARSLPTHAQLGDD